ncbi:TonB family protein [Candidatus Vecturithrix granuli]|uniref:TonB family protein n=1 Tax=Vecturithrix granuli TaxID=1499967 RepID=A0A081C1K2_VECG1|nr:TonB family protein [Candidatus Vecturithrix granuli]
MKHLNKKKKKSLWVEYSNSTIYFAFILSLILHTIVIYSIPAVNVFSEGPDSSAEPIVVDFFQEDSTESLTDISQADSDQFLADIPTADDRLPIEQPADVVETETESDRSDLEMAIPRMERHLDTDNGTFLLSQFTESKPDISLLSKRSLSQIPDHEQPLIPKQQPLEKVAMTPPSHPFQIQPPREVNEYEPVKMRTSSHKQLPQQDSGEQGIQLPLRPPQHEKSPSMLSQDTSVSPFHTGKLQVTEFAKESPALDFARKDITTFSQKRQFGIVKEKETDTNQFGIFAGKKFDELPAKDTVEEALPVAQQTLPLREETELAQKLTGETQIEGPIKGRAIIRRPQPPQVNVSIEVELRLKFWVLPDGTIGEVIPIKRGDAQLERIAITYLKQWRFEPLSPGVPQEKIWGTIPIRFTVQ